MIAPTLKNNQHSCQPVNFAQIEVKLLVAHLLQRYHFAPIAEKTPVHRGYWITRTPGGVQSLLALAKLDHLFCFAQAQYVDNDQYHDTYRAGCEVPVYWVSKLHACRSTSFMASVGRPPVVP